MELTEPTAPPASRRRTVAAVLVGIAVQLAAWASVLAAVIVTIDLWFDPTDETGSSNVRYLGYALLALAMGLWITSGWVAARIARDARYWAMLALTPALVIVAFGVPML
jgi:hypothetical protein